MPQYCAVPGCSDTGGFIFPKDEQLRLKWCVAIKRGEPQGPQEPQGSQGPQGRKVPQRPRKRGPWMPNKYSRVCPKHFKSEDFKIPIKSIIDVGGKTRRDLKVGTVPAIFLHLARDARQNRSAEKRSGRLERRRQQVSDSTHIKC
jgi:hypothetical protein